MGLTGSRVSHNARARALAPLPASPDLADAILFRALAGGVPYALRPAAVQRLYELLKRALDAVLSLVLLLLAAPVLATIALLIKATSRGPVLFRQRRLGRGGREFWCYKFRTMVTDAEARLQRDARLRRQFEASYKIKDDPRVTRLGALLRKTSLDELPQLFHVLRGEMSLIGPRPIVPPELSRYGIHQDRLLAVRPGLGGLWQACGRSETSYAERIRLDMIYIDQRCLLLDLYLLFLTARSVLAKRGAC